MTKKRLDIITSNTETAMTILAKAQFSDSQWEYFAQVNGYYLFRNTLSQQVMGLSDTSQLAQIT